jgi:YtkA-like
MPISDFDEQRVNRYHNLYEKSQMRRNGYPMMLHQYHRLKTPLLIALALATALALAGCRQSAQSTPTPAILATPTLTIEMAVAPTPPTTGEAELIVSVHSPDGAPISDARVAVRSDMTHAGMPPVLAEAASGTNGEYRVPFEWTMGGDWIVTITVTTSDGLEHSQTFEMTVSA